jgi:hypothetical protein
MTKRKRKRQMANTEVSYEVVEVKSVATTTTTKKAVVLDETNVLALIAKKKTISETISAQTAELEKIKAEIYALMGWEKIKVNKKDKWVGEAEVGLVAGEERVKIDLRERTDFDGDILFNDYREIFDLVAKTTEYPVLTAK